MSYYVKYLAENGHWHSAVEVVDEDDVSNTYDDLEVALERAVALSEDYGYLFIVENALAEDRFYFVDGHQLLSAAPVAKVYVYLRNVPGVDKQVQQLEDILLSGTIAKARFQ